MKQETQPSALTSSGLEHQTYLALQRLALQLKDETEQFFKQEGMTGTQFNVLRILRGASEPLTCSDIAGRLLNKDPDVTRLLDRMEKQGLIERARSEQDRRVYLIRLSPQGDDLVSRLDSPLLALHQQQFHHMPQDRLQMLLELLNEAGISTS